MYEMTQEYQAIKNDIKHELNQVAESFVEIGYRLKQVRDGELYKIDGYSNINEFARAEFSLSQSTTSRFIAINDKYSANGSSPKLLKQYEGLGYSKLSEMLTLSEEEIKLVTVQTTVAEIREIKQVKKETENENYATSHNAQSPINTQSESTFSVGESFIIPEADKLIVDFFRIKDKRPILKDISGLLAKGFDKETIAKAAELVNPSGHLMFRRVGTILMFEEDHIKYNKFGQKTLEFTYNEFFSDVIKVFDMSLPDPWVAFYGEPEPDPEPVKQVNSNTPVKQPEPKVTQTITKETKTVAKTEKTQYERNSDIEKKEEKEIPGQIQIEEYPELLPDSEENDIEELHFEQEGPAEIVEADVVRNQAKPEPMKLKYDEASGEVHLYISRNLGINSIKVIDIDTGESWEVDIN